MPTDKPTHVSRGICRGTSETGEATEMWREQKYDVFSTINPCDILVPSKDKYNRATRLTVSWAVNIEIKCLVNGVAVNANTLEIFTLDGYIANAQKSILPISF